MSVNWMPPKCKFCDALGYETAQRGTEAIVHCENHGLRARGYLGLMPATMETQGIPVSGIGAAYQLKSYVDESDSARIARIADLERQLAEAGATINRLRDMLSREKEHARSALSVGGDLVRAAEMANAMLCSFQLNDFPVSVQHE